MADGAGNLPKFPGELADNLPPREPEPRDRWADRFRHAWFLYVALAIVATLWIASMVAAVVEGGRVGWFFAMVIAVMPFAIYARVMQLRMLTGRDPDTGERLDRRER